VAVADEHGGEEEEAAGKGFTHDGAVRRPR